MLIRQAHSHGFVHANDCVNIWFAQLLRASQSFPSFGPDTTTTSGRDEGKEYLQLKYAFTPDNKKYLTWTCTTSPRALMFAHYHDHDFHCSGTWRKNPRFPARFMLDERLCLWDYRLKLPIYAEMPANAREELQVIVCRYLNLGRLVG